MSSSAEATLLAAAATAPAPALLPTVKEPVSLSGLPESVYARAVASFAEHAPAPALFLPISVLEAAARSALGVLFSQRRFNFFSPLAASRWPAGLPLGAWDIFVGALFPGRSLEGAAHAGLVLHLLFPAGRSSMLPVASLEEMVRSSAPEGAPDEVTVELTGMLRQWALGDAAANNSDAGITREGFLHMTYALEEMTEELTAEEAAAAAAAGENAPAE